jgi:hypothetical protein
MLNQQRVTMRQEFERRRTEYIESCRADFRSKTDTALARYKQGRKALEHQVRDLEADLKGAHEVRLGVRGAPGHRTHLGRSQRHHQLATARRAEA